MTKIALFPGSFNPWHEGHEDVLNKALKIFDKVIILQAGNPEKEIHDSIELPSVVKDNPAVTVDICFGLLRDYVKNSKCCAIVRGLRNSQDFEYEKIQQYVNEDLGVSLPFFFVISDRTLVHKSSTVIRALKKIESK